MNRYRTITIWALALTALTPAAADLIATPVAKPVAHPATTAAGPRTASLWRTATGDWGEFLSSEMMKLRGYQQTVHVKSPAGQGLDVVAIRRDARGRITDFRIVETKTHRTTGRALLKRTRSGLQASRQWVAHRLRAMRASGDTSTRRLAAEISRFRRASGRDWTQFVEVHEINTRTGKFRIWNPHTGKLQAEQAVTRALRRVQALGRRPARQWADATLASWNRIQTQSMSRWLGKGVGVRRALSQCSRRLAARLARQSAKRLWKRAARIAGPLGAAAAFGADAYEAYQIVEAYRTGSISKRQMVTRLAGKGGGVAGAAAGAALGAWVGAFGGPLAVITVPLGAAVGGTLGYLGGEHAGGAVANAWYARIDAKVQDKVDAWFLKTPASAALPP